MANEALTEKVSVNINSSTLSSIDLLVDHGYYSNRSDFINQALRSALQDQQSTIDRLIQQNTPSDPQKDPWFLGVYGFTKRDIEQSFQAQESFAIRGYGVLIIPEDCPEEQVRQVIQSIHVKGKVCCSPSLKAYYGLK